MKRHGMSLIELLSIIAIVIVTGVALCPVLHRFPPHRAMCQSNLKQIGLGLLQYTTDYGERFPAAGLGSEPYGWADALRPYIRSVALYHCSTRAQLVADNTGQTNPTKLNYTDYWLNFALSTRDITTIGLPTRTMLSGDGNDGHDDTTAHYALSRLPPAWLKDTNSPAYRHLETMNLLFADGHVKALKPTKIVTSPHNGPSFALR